MDKPTPFEFSWDEFVLACTELARKVKASGPQPELIIGMETGGAFVAGVLKKLLGARTMIVVDVVEENEKYRLGGLTQLTEWMIVGKHVLGVDDGIVKGDLFRQLTARITALGGIPRSASMVGIGEYPRLPGLVVARDLPVTPKLPWKLPVL